MIKAEIIQRETQGSSVAVICLKGVDQELPNYSAGAHIDVRVSEGITRQYSLCGDSSQSGIYRLGVLNDPHSRGGSKAIFESFQISQEVHISLPRNHFPLGEHKGKAVLIGGGIGITPLISMAYSLKNDCRPFELHYCVKTVENAGFINELQMQFSQELSVYESKGTPSKRLAAEILFSTFQGDEHVYICGPTHFMDSIVETARSLGIASNRLHTEYFSSDVELGGEAFEVICQQSGKTLNVAADQTIADALKKAGIAIQLSCEEGVCGTCITDVLSGTPEHRDKFLSDEEKADNDQIAVCCSRAKGNKLVLDI